MLEVAAHPLLDLYAFVTGFAAPLENLPVPAELSALLREEPDSRFAVSDSDRQAVRDLLRFGGFKPTGRSKPASEYLRKAQSEGTLGSLNPAVDACNVVSLHSGLPISVVDLDLARPPLRVAIAEPGSAYVFNASGQSIDVGGLLCLFDRQGPCANAVKDSQRTKTSPATRRTLSLIWSTTALPGRGQQVAEWYHQLLRDLGAGIEVVWPGNVE
jgi:DNA/RNA-binding domain of Phe-tRNA-synthetase-like protein